MGETPINSDFRDLLAAFNAAEVRYLIVGGYAFSFHVEPRYTKDLDLLVDATPTNAPRVVHALREFGAPLGGVTIADFMRPGIFFVMGVPPARIDVLTSIDGVDFALAWERRVVGRYGGVPVPFIGRDDLIRNKRTVARPQDLADVAKLERYRPVEEKPSLDG